MFSDHNKILFKSNNHVFMKCVKSNTSTRVK